MSSARDFHSKTSFAGFSSGTSDPPEKAGKETPRFDYENDEKVGQFNRLLKDILFLNAVHLMNEIHNSPRKMRECFPYVRFLSTKNPGRIEEGMRF